MGIFGAGRFETFQKDLPRVDGKVFVITGTTSGTGFVAAKTIAELGGEVITLNRQSSRVDNMLKKLNQEVPEGKFVTIECDLQNFESVRKAAKEIKSRYKNIYCLANNAGIMAVEDAATVDGFDIQMQTNHLAHFLLTAELLPLLKAQDGEARIVNHSSIARDQVRSKEGLEKKYFEKNGGSLGGNGLTAKWERYSQTKRANIVMTQALHEKLQASPETSSIKSVCAHPGVSATNLSDHLVPFKAMSVIAKPLNKLLLQSPEDGAMGLLMGCLSPEAKSGGLYGPTSLGGTKGMPVDIPIKSHENDPEVMSMLWSVSEEAVGQKFVV